MSLELTKGLTLEWWTPAGHENDDNPVAFHIRPLTGPQMMIMRKHFNIEAQSIEPEGLLLACRDGLRGWRNVLDENGDSQVFHRSMIDRLPHDWIALIGAQVISNSVMTEAAQKNS